MTVGSAVRLWSGLGVLVGVVSFAGAFGVGWAMALPSSTSPPPATTTTSRSGDGSGTGDGFTPTLRAPVSAMRGSAMAVHGTNWLCDQVSIVPNWAATPTSAVDETAQTGIVSAKVGGDYTFAASVPVPKTAALGASTLWVSCTADPDITDSVSVRILAVPVTTTVPISTAPISTEPVVTEEPAVVDPVPPTADAHGPDGSSGSPSAGPAGLVGLLLVGGAIALAVRGRSRPPDPGRPPVGVRVPPEQREPEVSVRVHADPRPRLDFRTVPARVPTVEIRTHRPEPFITVREVR